MWGVKEASGSEAQLFSSTSGSLEARGGKSKSYSEYLIFLLESYWWNSFGTQNEMIRMQLKQEVLIDRSYP